MARKHNPIEEETDPATRVRIKALEKRSEVTQLIERRRQALTSVAERLNRVMTGHQKLTAEMMQAPYHVQGAPAWTDGEHIYFNKDEFTSLLTPDPITDLVDLHKATRVFFGTNYHELAHVMFSSRSGDKFVVMLKEWGAQHGSESILWHPYMMLEDQRIETMYTTLYKPTTHYFQVSVMTWLIDSGIHADLYPLVYGRKFLDFDVRKSIRNLFVAAQGETTTRKVEDLIDSYLTVVFPLDTLKARQLVIDFYNLLQSTNVNPPHQDAGCSSQPAHMGKGERSPDEAVEATRQVAKDIEADKEEIREPDTDDSDTDSDNESDDEKAGTLDGGKPSDKADKADDDAESLGSGDGEGVGDDDNDGDKPSGGIGTGKPSDKDARNEIKEMIEENIKEIESSPEMREELDKAVQAVRSEANADLSVAGEYLNYRDVSVPGELLLNSNRIVQHVSRLQDEADPAWLRQQSVGRLDVRRALRRRANPSLTEIYDRWDEGSEDMATVEVVMLIDLSSSMSSVMGVLSKSLWTLKRSFDRCHVRTTVLGFADGHVPLYKPQEKIESGIMRNFNAAGGTNPLTAFQTAHHIFARSDATNKLLVTLTDGAWGAASDPLVNSLRRSGVFTVLYHIPTGYSQFRPDQKPDAHCHELVDVITSASDLTGHVKRLVEEMIAASAL